MKYTGRSMPRQDVASLVTGLDRFVADQRLADSLFVRFVRSPAAHGKVRSIDTSAVAGNPDVFAIWTAADAKVPPMPVRVAPTDTLDPFRQPVLADRRVRFVGEAVAAVFATSAAAATDAAEAIVVDVATAEPSLDPLAERGRALDELRTMDAAVVRKGFGDLHPSFDQAAKVIELTLSLARDNGAVMTPRAAAASYDPGRGQLDVWTSARDRAFWRAAVARALGLTLGQVRLAVPALGADFGVQADMAPEEMLVAAAAVRFGRAVRWEEDCLEHALAAPQGRGCQARVRAAVRADGTPRALDVAFWLDQGAYVRPDGLQRAEMIAALLPSCVALEAFRAVGHVRMTHKVPAGTLRGGGGVEAAFVAERTLSACAETVSANALDARRAALPLPVEAPSPAGLSPPPGQSFGLDSARLSNLMRVAEQRFDFPLMRRKTKSWRVSGQVAGFGTAMFADVSGLGPGEMVTVTVDPTGMVEIALQNGATPRGATSLAQVAADILGVEYQSVVVRLEERASQRASSVQGMTAVAGAAVMEAAEDLRQKLLDKAAAMAGMDRARVTIQAGRVREADRNFGGSLELAALASACNDAGEPLTATRQLAPEGVMTPTGYCGAIATVDVATGVIAVPRLFIAVECGNAINPEEIRRQVVDGAAMGLSSALFTQRQIGPTGDPIGLTFQEYCAPALSEMAQVEVLVCDDAPSPLTPLGAKGVGRMGVIGVGPAVAAAVDAALEAPGFAAALPITPSAVRSLLRSRATEAVVEVS
ncbi:MAG: molybdopterin cofactor-binding domain-containing protein [Pseudomonadota bacterium]